MDVSFLVKPETLSVSVVNVGRYKIYSLWRLIFYFYVQITIYPRIYILKPFADVTLTERSFQKYSDIPKYF